MKRKYESSIVNEEQEALDVEKLLKIESDINQWLNVDLNEASIENELDRWQEIRRKQDR